MTLLYKRHAAYVRHYVMTLNMTLLQSFAAHLHGDDAYDDAHTISYVAMRESYGRTDYIGRDRRTQKVIRRNALV